MAQVLLSRFILPPLTWTMWERAWSTMGSDEGFRWPDYRPMRLADLGDNVGRAVVASEDGWFFHHAGFDTGQIHDALTEIHEGTRFRGASTISQQVARNVFLWQGGGWFRKALEAGYTVLIELLLPKERILELYLNVAETGPMTFGMEAGAWRWYQRPAAALSSEQAARIAAILPNPDGWPPDGPHASRRAAEILRWKVPFPGEPGFEEMQADAPEKVGCRALFGW